MSPRRTTDPSGIVAAVVAFLVIGNIVFSSAYQESLFLAHHPRTEIPVAMLVGGVLAVLAAAGMSPWLRRGTPDSVLRATLVALAAGTAAVALWNRTPGGASTFGQFVFVEVASTLGSAATWAHIQAPLTPSDARRLMPRVGVCAGLGAVAGGLVVPLALQFLRPEDLVGPSALAWLLPVPFVRSSAAARPRSAAVLRSAAATGARSLLRIPLVRISLVATAGLIWVMLAVQYEARVALQSMFDAAGIARATGRILAASAAVGLLIQAFLARPILERWGVGLALSVLPMALALFLGAHAVVPSVWLVLAAFSADRSLRPNLYRAAESCLVSALPGTVRPVFVLAMAGMVTPLFRAVESLLLWGAAGVPGLIAGSALAVCCGLAALGFLWRTVYRQTLQETLRAEALEAPGSAGDEGPVLDVLDRPRLEALLDALDHGSSRARALALELLRPHRGSAVRQEMERRLESPSESLRIAALGWFAGEPLPPSTRDRLRARWSDPATTVPERIALMEAPGREAPSLFGQDLVRLAADPALNLRAAAAGVLLHAADLGRRTTALACVRSLLESSLPEERNRGLLLAEHSPDAEIVPALLRCATHADPSARRNAMPALARQQDPRATAALYGAMEDPRSAHAAAAALASRGEKEVGEIVRWTGEVAPAARVHLVRALGLIGDPSAIPCLMGLLAAASRAGTVEVLRALNRIHAANGTTPEAEKLRDFGLGELRWGLSLLRAQETLRKHLHARSLLAREIVEQIERSRLRVSRGLALLSTPGTMADVYWALRTPWSPLADQAKELLAQSFPPGPLLAGSLKLLGGGGPWPPELGSPPLQVRSYATPEAAVDWLAGSGDPWILSAIRNDPEVRSLTTATPAAGDDPMASTLDTILFLKDVALFEGLTNRQLAEVARLAEPVDAVPGSILFQAGDASDSLYLIRQGRLQALAREREVARFGPGQCVGEMGVLGGMPRTATVQAVEPSRLLRFDGDDFLALLDTFPEIGKGLLRTMILRLSRATEGAVDSLETMYGMIQSQVGPAGPDRK